MYFKQETITPEIATEMLAKNFGNRRVNGKRVTMLAKDMESGNWTESPQPISFDPDGNLLDGQHRLTAIKKSGIPVQMSVAYEVPKEAVIDRVLERSPGDALYMRGMIGFDMSHKEVMAIVNRYLDNIDGCDSSTMPDSEKAAFINDHEGALKKTLEVTTFNSSYTLSKRASVRAAILGAIINSVDVEKIKAFCEVLNTGFMDNPNQSAAIVLRNYLLTFPTQGQGAANKAVICAEMAIRDFVSDIPRRNRYSKKAHVYVKM